MRGANAVGHSLNLFMDTQEASLIPDKPLNPEIDNAPTGQYNNDLSAVIAKCIIGISITDAKGYYEQVNDAYCKIYGYTRNELIGKHFTLMAPAVDRNTAWQQMHNEFINSGAEIAGEWIVKNKGSQLLNILTEAARISAESGGYRKLTFVQDISELRALQQDANQTQNRAQALFNLSSAPTVYADVVDLIIKEASKHWKHLVGYRLDEVIELDEPWPEVVRKARLHRHLLLEGTLKPDTVKGEVQIEFLRNSLGEELLVVFTNVD